MTTRQYRQQTLRGFASDRTAIGLKVAVKSTDHGTLIGTVERIECTRAVVRFGDGRWTYSDARLAVLRDQSAPVSFAG